MVLSFYSGFEALTTKPIVKLTKTTNHKKHQNHCTNREKPEKPPFSSCLSKSRIRGFFGFCSGFDGQELETTVKNQAKPPATTTNHQNYCKNQEKPKTPPFSNYLSKSRIRGFFLGFCSVCGGQELWFFSVFTVVLVVCCGCWWFFLAFTVVSSS